MEPVGVPNLSNPGLITSGERYVNLPREKLIQMAFERKEGVFSREGVLCVQTGQYTGRAAQDKYTVLYPETENEIWYNEGNKKISLEISEKILKQIQGYYADKDLFIRNCFAGEYEKYHSCIQLITETAWHNAFGSNMFIDFPEGQASGRIPDIVIYHAPSIQLSPAEFGLRSKAFVISDFKKKIVMIGGTHYAGEIKKSVFSFMNYMLPQKGVMGLHAAANVGERGDTAVFFGLSGTGKTTLSSEAGRSLIGDDEHGWSDDGIFNMEGGCYAKLIHLSKEAEPEIYAAIQKPGAILENIVVDPETNEIDLDDDSITENIRGSYPVSHLGNFVASRKGDHPTNVIMLTADAFGVLPPVSKLTREQAMYHFLSGYTAKVAGTETGIKEPVAAFSACFGAPFMPLHPIRYAELFCEKITYHNASVYLVNTGWSGGGFGEGSRMPINETRAIIHSILDGHFNTARWKSEPYFGLNIPESCPGVRQEILFPKNTWKDASKYGETVLRLKEMFRKNFKQYKDQISEKFWQAGF